MSRPIIEVENLSKLYHLGVVGATTLRESFDRWRYRMIGKEPPRKIGSKQIMIDPNDPQAGPEPNSVWALKDVSFSVKPGEIVGIIGRNGAGKSTILKILSKITEPTSGRAVLRGRVASLLEVGTGFHPELTGRENIYLNGAILGMRKHEIDKKFNEIVAFSEIEKFIDTPVKHYSSGMNVRLGFAVAAHLEPEILLVDEVLAVGDVSFQNKCLGKMGQVAKAGRTVIFVSHSMGSITQLCEKTFWFDQGQLKLYGPSIKVVEAYLSCHQEVRMRWVRPLGLAKCDEIEIQFAQIVAGNEPATVVGFNQPFKVEIGYEIISTINLALLARITDSQGNIVWTSWDTDMNVNNFVRQSGKYISVCKIPKCLLRPGYYRISIGAIAKTGSLIEYHEDVVRLNVSEVGFTLNQQRLGIVTPLLDWEMKP